MIVNVKHNLWAVSWDEDEGVWLVGNLGGGQEDQHSTLFCAGEYVNWYIVW